ncbi:MAG: hypothetical protein EOP49_21895, partial [Sphingobacteriales bacterium]
MPRWLKRSIRIVLVLVLICLVAWGGLIIYVQRNQDFILTNIRTQLNEHISGKLDIGKLETDLVNGFPGVSVTLYDVRLTDSLFEQHRYPLLQAGKVFVYLDARSVLQKNIRIRKLEIAHGKINLFTDSNGLANTHVFREKKARGKEGSTPRLEAIAFADIEFVMRNIQKQKLYRLHIQELQGGMEYKGNIWKAAVHTRMTVHDMAFNTDKGSFLKDKPIRASFSVHIDRDRKSISIPEDVFYLGDEKVRIAARFGYRILPARFAILIKAKSVGLSAAASMLTPAISSKLRPITMDKPIDLDARIEGRFLFRDTPLVVVNWVVKNNTLGTPVGDITNASFRGRFINEIVKGGGHSDHNSMIRLYGFKGSWEGIPFSADSVIIADLISPVLQGRFVSNFPLSKLNSIIGGRSFAFRKGNASLDLTYKGGIRKQDTALAYVYGTINATDATVLYKPRNLSFVNTAASIRFRGRDVEISNVRLSQGSSVINMNGSLKNFLSLYYTDPGKMVLDWNIRSNRLDLNDFTGFLAKRQTVAIGPEPEEVKQKPKANAVAKMSGQMDRVLDEANVRLTLSVGEMVYRKFSASRIDARVTLRSADIVLDHVRLNHAGGAIEASGRLDQGGTTNRFEVDARINQVDVQRFFASMGNFNQDAITDAHVRGKLIANANIS